MDDLLDFSIGQRRGKPLIEKIEERSTWEPNTGCRLWLGSQNGVGYGRVWDEGTSKYVHRVAWELEHGPIPDDLVLDHICRVRSCLNPAHLRVVTMKENTLAGVAPAAQHARKTACPRGHAYDVMRNGGRRCSICDKAAAAAFNAAHPDRFRQFRARRRQGSP